MIIKGTPTPYSTAIEPILKEMHKNPFKEEVELGDGKKLLPEEMISWLDIIKLKNKQKTI